MVFTGPFYLDIAVAAEIDTGLISWFESESRCWHAAYCTIDDINKFWTIIRTRDSGRSRNLANTQCIAHMHCIRMLAANVIAKYDRYYNVQHKIVVVVCSRMKICMGTLTNLALSASSVGR